ncbi:MAG TPA: hypothetical protein PKX45_05935, partial [Bacillota bacterium]|nr:hypothetical protein [Bacillota bacterium]
DNVDVSLLFKVLINITTRLFDLNREARDLERSFDLYMRPQGCQFMLYGGTIINQKLVEHSLALGLPFV